MRFASLFGPQSSALAFSAYFRFSSLSFILESVFMSLLNGSGCTRTIPVCVGPPNSLISAAVVGQLSLDMSVAREQI